MNAWNDVVMGREHGAVHCVLALSTGSAISFKTNEFNSGPALQVWDNYHSQEKRLPKLALWR